MKILVVEDDVRIASLVTRGLELEGYKVDTCSEGNAGLRLASTGNYQAIILDVMLPELSGFEIVALLRKRAIETPVLILTAREALDDKITGLDAGADDYLPKPFEMKELLARVRALLRRDRTHKAQVMEIEGLVIDVTQRKVSRDGQPIGLSKREFDLLLALASHEGRVYTREMILTSVWDEGDSFSNVVDVYVAALRKKVDSGYTHKFIQTIRGVGYRFSSLGGEHGANEPAS